MTKTEQMRLATALRLTRPPVFPGTRIVLDPRARELWFRVVTEIAHATFPAGAHVPSEWLDAVGVPN